MTYFNQKQGSWKQHKFCALLLPKMAWRHHLRKMLHSDGWVKFCAILLPKTAWRHHLREILHSDWLKPFLVWDWVRSGMNNGPGGGGDQWLWHLQPGQVKFLLGQHSNLTPEHGLSQMLPTLWKKKILAVTHHFVPLSPFNSKATLKLGQEAPYKFDSFEDHSVFGWNLRFFQDHTRNLHYLLSN